MKNRFSTTLIINAEPSLVWITLTSIELMTQWMGDPEMKIEIQTDWKINDPIFIRGFHHTSFENKGVVSQYHQNRKLVYSHLSSTSHLPDKPENYSILEFILTPVHKQTSLTLNITNFPTLIIQKHLEFYWRTTIVTIKKITETQAAEKSSSHSA
jgi:uncharacterized protein YndB with AHSA1/START domain